MTANYHTPIPTGAAADASVFNSRYSQLDSAITGIVAGSTPLTRLNIGAPVSVTMAANAFTISASHQKVNPASGSNDTLRTINGGVSGDLIFLMPDATTDFVVVEHSTGNIFLNNRESFVLTGNNGLLLIFNGTYWHDVGNTPDILTIQAFS